jgi:hypothetical protein
MLTDRTSAGKDRAGDQAWKWKRNSSADRQSSSGGVETLPPPPSSNRTCGCRDRSAAHDALGSGGLPTPFDVVLSPTPVAHDSASPPAIPDGRISRVRFWPRLCTPFSGSRSSQTVKGSSDGTRTPPTFMVHLPPRSDPGRPRTPSTASGCGPDHRSRRVPRAPLPAGGVTRDGAASGAASEDVTPPSKLVRAHAPVPPPLIAFG